MPASNNSGYQEDLAYIHDVGYGEFARKSAPGLLGIFGQKGIKEGLVIDLGCGSGIWAAALTEAGYDVLGIDISQAMIDLAKKKAPKAEFQVASFLKANLPKCEAITSISECLNYQFDEHDRAELGSLFNRIYEALKPGGVFIFDIGEPGYLRGANPQNSYSEGKDWAILLEKKEDKGTNMLTRKITIFRQVGELYRRSEEIHYAQLYKGSEIAKQLRKIGFRVRIIRSYGELKFRKALVGFIGTKV